MTVALPTRNLERLSQLYTAGFGDVFIGNALNLIVRRQIARDEADLQHVQSELADFEQQYGMATDDFWRRFQAGQMIDTADFMEWNVLCKARQRLLTRLEILRGNGVHE